MVGSTLICIKSFKIQAGTQLKLAFGGFETGLKFIIFRLSFFIRLNILKNLNFLSSQYIFSLTDVMLENRIDSNNIN